MKPYKLAPDIYVIEDFVTEDQQQRALEFIGSLDESMWYHDQTKEGDFFWGRQYSGRSPDFILDMTQNLKIFVNNNYMEDGSKFRLEIQRHRKDDYHGQHKDNHSYGSDLEYKTRFGVCVYYNDDYLGGELIYPELNIIHKPKARSLVMHGGNILHGTTPLQSDSIRYFSTCFIKGNIEDPVILNPLIFSDIEESDGSFYY
jgi:hypothetical protein